jgi:hypothetical protein
MCCDTAGIEGILTGQSGLFAGGVVLGRRGVLSGVCAMAGVAALTGSVASDDDPGRRPAEPGPGNLALVYRGPATDADCADAVAGMLRGAGCGLDVRFTGPGEPMPLSRESLSRAKLYAQPGGGGLLDGYQQMKAYRRLIRTYVDGGGRYLGVCLGAYLAGSDPGFDLLPVSVDQYITSPGASVRAEDDTVVRVTWRGRSRFLFFQDGPVFRQADSPDGVDVFATYSNGLAAALLARRGAGRVGVVGPHVEATQEWYDAYDLSIPDGVHPELGFDFVQRLISA